jgi:hypothetical protein
MIRVLLGSLLLAALPAAAQMYKWVDEKGVTHFSETPPPDGKGTKVDVKPSGPPASGEAPDWKQRDLDSRRERIAKEQKEQAQQAKEHNAAAARKNRCAQAQRELKIVQAPRPVYTVNEKGEKVYLEDADRMREIEGWKERVRNNCD